MDNAESVHGNLLRMKRAPRVAEVAPEHPSGWQWAQTTLVAVNLVWTTLCLGGYRPETMVVTSALTCLLLSVHLLERVFRHALFGREAPRSLSTADSLSNDPSGWWFLPFLVYAALNVLVVSPVRWLGWLDWHKWANMLTIFWIVINAGRVPRLRKILFLTLIALGVIGVAMGCYQRFVQPDWLMLGRHQVEQFFGRASGSFGIPNSLAAFLVLLLPVAGVLTFRQRATAVERVWWGWVTVVFAFGLLLTMSRGAWIGLVLALLAWPLSTRRWRWRRRVAFAGFALAGLICVSAVVVATSPKFRDRIERLVRDSGELSRPILWRAGWNLFREHPLIGTGAGSYNVLFERYRPSRFADEPQWAHNDYLNTLSDYGAIGFVLFFGAGGAIALRHRRADRNGAEFTGDWFDSPSVTGALGIGVLAFAIQLFVDFHLKIPALAMACATVAALALNRPEPALFRGTSPPNRMTRYGWLGALAAVMIASVAIVRFYQAEAFRYSARQAMDVYTRHPTRDLNVLATEAEAALRNAVRLAPSNASAWSDLAFALELQALTRSARTPEVAGLAEESASRALAISAVVPEFWIRFGSALDMQSRFAEAQNAFERALQLAPNNAAGWYYYAHHLSFDTKQREAALRAIANCLSLDPGNSAAAALRVKLNERLPDALPVP
jgi:O-antigen ligase